MEPEARIQTRDRWQWILPALVEGKPPGCGLITPTGTI